MPKGYNPSLAGFGKRSLIICWLMRCDSGYEIRTRRSFLVREGHDSYSFRKRRSQLLLCKTTIFVLRMRLKCINANSDFTCLTSQFNILDCPLADDSILPNVAVSVSEEVLWKPVARVVFRYSTQTQAENFFTRSTKPERIYEAVNRHYLCSAMERKHEEKCRNMKKNTTKTEANDEKQEVKRGERWRG